jgi:type VI secretion system secreted protein VgrG
VTLASTTGKLSASAKQKILATAQGAYLKIEGGNIELHAPKKVGTEGKSEEFDRAEECSSGIAEFSGCRTEFDTERRN